MIEYLPAVNAFLNATAAVLLVRGFLLKRWRRRDDQHPGAFSAGRSLVHHAFAGIVLYQKTGLIRAVYLSILGTHTVLAAAVPVLAIIALRRGLKGNFVRHKAVAKWTLPIWLYVSVTGVVVYFMLYQF